MHLEPLQGKEDTAKVVFEKDKAQREQTEKVVYEQFLMGVNNVSTLAATGSRSCHRDVKRLQRCLLQVSDWLLGPGEKWLLTLHEIGESSDETEQLKRDHDQLKNKARVSHLRSEWPKHGV